MTGKNATMNIALQLIPRHIDQSEGDGGLSTKLLINFGVSSAVQWLIRSLVVCAAKVLQYNVARASSLGTFMEWKSTSRPNKENAKIQ